MTKLQEMANKFYLGAVETAKARGQKIINTNSNENFIKLSSMFYLSLDMFRFLKFFPLFSLLNLDGKVNSMQLVICDKLQPCPVHARFCKCGMKMKDFIFNLRMQMDVGLAAGLNTYHMSLSTEIGL